MPRLMGVDIPGKKHSRYALRYIHGIGPKRADDVLAACKIDAAKKADDLTQDEIHAITTFIQDHYLLHRNINDLGIRCLWNGICRKYRQSASQHNSHGHDSAAHVRRR